MFNNRTLHSRIEGFINDSLYLHYENEQLPMILFFRNVYEDPLRISNINLIANSRKFSYTRNNLLNWVVFRKSYDLFPYKRHSYIRDFCVNLTELASPTKFCLKDVNRWCLDNKEVAL